MKDIEEQYLLFKDDIGRVATYISGSSDFSQDITQDVFLELVKSKNNYKGKSSIKTYILAITRNVARGYIKKLVKQRKIFKRGKSEFDETYNTSTVDEKMLLNMALKKIKSKYREPLLLKEMEGLSYQEISEVLNIKLGTVKSRISFAKSKILTFLNGGKGGIRNEG